MFIIKNDIQDLNTCLWIHKCKDNKLNALSMLTFIKMFVMDTLSFIVWNDILMAEQIKLSQTKCVWPVNTSMMTKGDYLLPELLPVYITSNKTNLDKQVKKTGADTQTQTHTHTHTHKK